MKTKIFTIIGFAVALLMSLCAKAQTTVALAKAGTLQNVANIANVQRLTLTGSIDARDVKFMRDSMLFLTELDLSEATVAAYEGEEGTYPYFLSYPANEMPQYSFCNASSYPYVAKTSLTSVKLPAGLTSIGEDAFNGCSGLSGNLNLPTGLTAIGSGAFYSCSGLSGNLILPAGLTFIGDWVFENCSGLSGNLTLPAGLTFIGSYAFSSSSFTSVTNLSLTPQNISNSDVFSGVSVENIALTVPTSSATLYENANVWKDFSSIIGGGVLLSVKANSAALGSVSGALSGLYPADADVSITATPASGYSLLGWVIDGVSLVADATLSFTLTQDTIVTANFGKLGSYNLTAAGTLKDIGSIETITHLTLTGSIDARDVKFMRDSMPFLTELDLSEANVVAYSGEDGTSQWWSNYPDNEMPQYSFCNASSYPYVAKTSLTSVKLPAGLTSIGEDAFSGCSRLSGKLTLPKGLTAIGSDAFQNCSGLSDSLILPASLTAIGDWAFENCSGLSSNLTLPASLASIGSGAFYHCSGLSGSLTLPAGLTAIGGWAFEYCSGLSGNLTLPAGLTFIGSHAFSGCSGFTSVTNLSLTPQNISSSDVFSGVSVENIALTVPSSSVALYENANVWKDFSSISGGGVLLSVKANNSALGSVSGTLSGLYPDNTDVSITATPTPALSYPLLSWTIGGASLGASDTLAFTLTQDTVIIANFGKTGVYNLAVAGTLKDTSGIEAVTHLTLTGSFDARDVKFMRDAMPFLTELDLSEATVAPYEGVDGTYPYFTIAYPANEMPQYSFYSTSKGKGKVSLISVKLPAGLTSIGEDAFYSCSGLSGNPTLPAGLTAIGSGAFYSCSGLSGSLTLPAGLTAIGDWAFESCSGLRGNLTLPASLTAIGDWTFYSCSGLSGSLTLPAGLTSIGGWAFENCSGLSGNLTLPAGLTFIGSHAFQRCSGFTSVTNLSLTPQNISNSDVFSGVSIENIALIVPTSSVALYEKANVWKDFKHISGGGILLSVKANNSALGSVSGTLSGLYPANTDVALTATPTSGLPYPFLSWTSGGASLGASATIAFTLTQDTMIIANFGKMGVYNLAAAGTLKNTSGIEAVTHLTLTGSIDARDVRFMRDSMPFLTELDLSGATVVAYEGEAGTIPDTLAYPAGEMPEYSFYNPSTATAKTSLTSVKLPESLTAIGSAAFAFCSGLSGSLTLPESLTAIGNEAFAYCSGLSGSLTLPEGLTAIGSGVFYSCSELSGNLTLPAGLTAIGDRAFQDCSGLTSVTNLSPVPQDIDSGEVFYSVNVGNVELRVPAASLAAYRDAPVWKDFYPVTGWATLRIAVSNRAWGSVAGADSGWQPVDSAVTLVAVPAQGYAFDSWTSGSASLGASATLTFTLTQDTVITANFIVQPPTGVESHAPGAARVYPNPTSGEVTVEREGAEVRLYSLQGALLRRTHGSRLDLSGYPSGVYLLRTGSKAARVVKQ
jgi:hypothetical protein